MTRKIVFTGWAQQVTNRLHVSATARDVVRAAHKALKPGQLTHACRTGRHQFIRDCLEVHRANRGLFTSARF
jgi:predicted methyltransferase